MLAVENMDCGAGQHLRVVREDPPYLANKKVTPAIKNLSTPPLAVLTSPFSNFFLHKEEILLLFILYALSSLLQPCNIFT